MNKNAKLHDGVWVGILDEYGFVVYDPSIFNLYVEDKISLWIERDNRRSYFSIKDVRKKLRKNLGLISDHERQRVVKHYWIFFCGSYSKAGCLKLREERRIDVLQEELKEPNCEAEQFCAEKERDYSMDSAEYLMLHR